MQTTTTPYPTSRSLEELLDLGNNITTGFQSRYQYQPGAYNAPQMNATFTPGQAVPYQAPTYDQMQMPGAFGGTANVQYNPQQYQAPAPVAGFQGGQNVQYNAPTYTPMQTPGQFTGGPAVQYQQGGYTPVQQAGTFGQQGPVGGTLGGMTQQGIGTGMQGATGQLSTLAATPWTSGYEGQAQQGINAMSALGRPQGNFQSGYGWQGGNLLQQAQQATGQNYSGILGRAGELANQAQTQAQTPFTSAWTQQGAEQAGRAKQLGYRAELLTRPENVFQSRTTGNMGTLANQTGQMAAQGFGYDDPLVQLQAQLAQQAQQNPTLMQQYAPLRTELIASARSGLNRPAGYDDAQFQQSLQAPIAMLQREQQKGLANLRDQLAAEGAYNTGRFQEMAAQNILEPYGQQVQNLVNQAYTSNLERRTTDELARQQMANQILGQSFGTEAGEAQLGLQGLQTRAGVGGTLAEQALGADQATLARIASALGVNQADLQRELATEQTAQQRMAQAYQGNQLAQGAIAGQQQQELAGEQVNQQRMAQALQALQTRGDLTGQMNAEQRAALEQAYGMLQGERGQEQNVETMNQARRAQQLQALQAGQGAMQGQQQLGLAGRQLQGQELQAVMNALGMQAQTYGQFADIGFQNQAGARADYATNLAGLGMNNQYQQALNQLTQVERGQAMQAQIANRQLGQGDYATNLAGMEMANKYGMDWNRLSQADQQYLTATAFQNQQGRREDYATNLAGQALNRQYGLSYDTLNAQNAQYAANIGMQNRGMTQQDYITGLAGITAGNQANLAMNQLRQGDIQFGTDVGFRNRVEGRADTAMQAALDAQRFNQYDTGWGRQDAAQQAQAAYGLQAIQQALGIKESEYGQYNREIDRTMANDQFMTNLANQYAMMGIYGQAGAGGTNINNYAAPGGGIWGNTTSPETIQALQQDRTVSDAAELAKQWQINTYMNNTIQGGGRGAEIANTFTPGAGLTPEIIQNIINPAEGKTAFDMLSQPLQDGGQAGQYANLQDPAYLPETLAAIQKAGGDISQLPEYMRDASGMAQSFWRDPYDWLMQLQEDPAQWSRFKAAGGHPVG